MTLEESKKLVRFLSALDGRRVTKDVDHAFHQTLGQYAYTDAKRAAETAAKNTTRDHCTIGEIIAVLRGEQIRAGHTHGGHCEHGMPMPGYCHDCTHNPDTCGMCQPIPGISDTPDNIRATIATFKDTWRR